MTVIEPYIYNLEIPDGSGGFKGGDAIVTANAGTATGIVTALDVFDSGFGYRPQEELSLTDGVNETSVTGSAVVRRHGRGDGEWRDRVGFASDLSFIQDSSYYQTFSYEIQAERMIETYESLVKNLVHPSGMALYGAFRLNSSEVEVVTLQESSFTQD